jgi:hypothetical protein
MTGVICKTELVRTVRYAVPAPGSGTFHSSKAHFNGQFLVFNMDSGDPSAAREQTTVSLR